MLIASTLSEGIQAKILYEIGVSSRRDRINYQLKLQDKSLETLLLERDENGKERTEEEKKRYEDTGYWLSNASAIRKQLSKDNPEDMSKEMYERCCKILRISPELLLIEAEKIKVWKNVSPQPPMDENGKKKRGRPTKAFKAKQREAFETVEEIVENRLVQEEEEQYALEEQIEQARFEHFNEQVQDLSDRELEALRVYGKLFDGEATEQYFLYFYLQMNEAGRQLVSELMKLHYDEEFLAYEDSWTEALNQLAGQKIGMPEDREQTIKEIWDKYLDRHMDEEYNAWSASISGELLKLKERDWNVLISYHRLCTFGKEIIYHAESGLEYVEVINCFIEILSKIPNLRRAQRGEF